MRHTGIRAITLVVLLALGLAARAGAEPRPLHAVRGSAPAVVDDLGRQVLLRGVNVNQLGDYFRTDPTLDPTLPLTDDDWSQIAGLGMDSVRLLVHWSALEPTPGAFDAAYAARVRAAIEQAATHDLHVVVDMHQDAWGKFVDTPAGTACPPGLSPAVGWDGAPRWATLTDGLTTCKASIRELSPAVGQAWQSFWLDREGIQQHLVDTWGRLVTALGPSPAIAGYDPINEPNPGYAVGATGATSLAAFYTRTLAAIRAAERRLPGLAAPRAVFFEPGVEWSAAAADAVPPPGFTDDPSVVFAPHLYSGSITVDRTVGVEALTPERGFALADGVAQGYGTTVWSGEWGWFGDPATDEAALRTYAAPRGHLPLGRRVLGLEAGLRRPAQLRRARRQARRDLPVAAPLRLPAGDGPRDPRHHPPRPRAALPAGRARPAHGAAGRAGHAGAAGARHRRGPDRLLRARRLGPGRPRAGLRWRRASRGSRSARAPGAGASRAARAGATSCAPPGRRRPPPRRSPVAAA